MEKKNEVVQKKEAEPLKMDLRTETGFADMLKNYERSIAQLLQTKYGISAEEFYVTCVNAVKKNPKLLLCDPKSLFGAILLSAEVGLKPNTPDQHAFIIPYKGQAKFQIGYKGLIAMMYRNPRVLSISGVAVYKKDEFDYGYGLNPFLNHKPHRGKDRGALIAVYAVCKMKDADPTFTVVEDYELSELREFSQSKDSEYSARNSGADVHNFMEIKAGIKKLSKLIPNESAHEIAKAIDYDSRFEGGASVQVALPNSSQEILEPNVIDAPQRTGMSSAFDALEQPLEEEIKKEKQEGDKDTVSKEVESSDKPLSNKEEVVSKKESEGEVDFATAGQTLFSKEEDAGESVNKEKSDFEKEDEQTSTIFAKDENKQEDKETLF